MLEQPVVTRTKEKKPRQKKAWTGKDISTLKEMAGKHSTEEIAKRLGRTPNAVAQRAHLLSISLSMNEIDPLMLDMARVLHEAGYTSSQIIHAFNVPMTEAKAIKRDLEIHKGQRQKI